VLEFATRAIVIGILATAILDLFNVFQKRAFKAPVPDWGVVGRWIGNFPRGRFAHASIAKAAPVRGERAIGWITHYVVGVAFAAIAVLVWGVEGARHPTFAPALIVGLTSMIAPFFIMQPGMGLGIAASKTPKPCASRLRSLISHTVFGVGVYLAALLVAILLPGR
jgi:hypothetical protein